MSCQVEWVAEVFPDWTTLQIIESGQAFAFNRATGKVYKVPHPDCPFVVYQHGPITQPEPTECTHERSHAAPWRCAHCDYHFDMEGA